MLKSLRVKVVLAFLIVVVPLLILTVYINQYGISVVRTKVTQSNTNLLNLYADQIERTLEEANTYVNKLSLGEPDLRSLHLYGLESPEYIYAKYSIINKLNMDNEYYGKVNFFFVLRKDPFDMIATYRPMASEQHNKQRTFLQSLLGTSADQSGWRVYVYDNSYVLIIMQKLNNSIYVGSWLQLDNLKIPLDLLDLGTSGRAMLLSGDNRLLADMAKTSGPGQPALSPVPGDAVAPDGEPYEVWQDEHGRHYMLVSQRLRSADLKLAVALLEKDVLARLPVFQKLGFILPFVVAVILLLYLLFFRKFLLQPLHALVKGMREASKGNLQVRVEAEQPGELDFLIHSFHDMMDKIKTLQIDVYEEKLRTQQAEMKQLQLQIQPHFYLNCLNIIYSLADLKKYEHIQGMAQYLSDYFRFTLHYAESVSLSQEIDHIRNYLEIQRFRYPNRLTFELSLAEPAAGFQLPPLLLLPFVENSIKHGMISDKPFHVRVMAEQVGAQSAGAQPLLRVVVEDNGHGFSEAFLK
ncbi:MAG: histidine kinase, partial [Paenibacillaceae bacterium]|nr:histidine kinase [Paenibacillaceae bacterium]